MKLQFIPLTALRCLALLLPILFHPLSTPAGDWPQWAGTPGKNMVSAAKGLPGSFVPGEKDSKSGEIILSTAKHVKWGVRTGTITYGSPTVSGGKVFIGSSDNRKAFFKCLDARNGKLLWQYTAPHRVVPEKIDGDWKFMF